jgi:hypothetical protein
VEWSAGKRAARGAAAVPPTVRVHGSVHDLRGGPSGDPSACSVQQTGIWEGVRGGGGGAAGREGSKRDV